MRNTLKNTGLMFVSIAMLLLLAHAMIPHHHHGEDTFIGCCSHDDESTQSANCSLHAEKQEAASHHCFKCSVEREWQVNNSSHTVFEALVIEDAVSVYLDAAQPVYHQTNTPVYRTYLSGVHYRGPPQG